MIEIPAVSLIENRCRRCTAEPDCLPMLWSRKRLRTGLTPGETLNRVVPSPKPMKVYSVNFLLEGKTPYKDLAPVFPDILKMLLEEIGQMPEEEEILQMLIDLNVSDLQQNRKPEGYNRKGKVRLVFPMDRDEFYIKTYIKTQDLTHIANNISNMLTAAGVKFTTAQNDDVEFN